MRVRKRTTYWWKMKMINFSRRVFRAKITMLHIPTTTGNKVNDDRYLDLARTQFPFFLFQKNYNKWPCLFSNSSFFITGQLIVLHSVYSKWTDLSSLNDLLLRSPAELQTPALSTSTLSTFNTRAPSWTGGREWTRGMLRHADSTWAYYYNRHIVDGIHKLMVYRIQNYNSPFNIYCSGRRKSRGLGRRGKLSLPL